MPHPVDPLASAARLSSSRLAERVWTLEALEKEATRTHPTVQLAEARYETARAAIRTAREMPNPTIALTPQIVTPYTSLMAGTYGVDFDWTIETAGKRNRRSEIAHANARASAANVVEAVWSVRAAVRKAFLELYAAEQRSRLLSDAVTRQDDLLKVLEQRILAGEEARGVMAQPRLLQAQLRLQASDVSRSLALARVSLAEALGMGVNGLAGARFSYFAFEKQPSIPSSARREALTHRADVLAALAEYASAEGALRLEIARQYPDLHLNPGYQLDQGVNKWTLGLGFTLPILNQNRGAIGEAEAKRKEAEVKFYGVQAKVLADCDRAVASLKAARAKVAVTETLLAEQARQISSEERMVAAGEGDKLALLSAQVERATTLTSRLDALVELQSALGALEEATQTPLK
ncbi:MAG: Heavy metal efflux outer membrane protein CzcC family [Chthoniobacteraceae bacterium]|nr:Heavy metal efflux outer membrane protein CzcC family [Chthoniobacteraceae bacterium]